MNIPQSSHCIAIFEQSIDDYHRHDHVDTPMQNPYPEGSFEYLLYKKNWIDTVQWHLEDLIRDPDISAETLVSLKRRIDVSNQARTDTVELMDDWFLQLFHTHAAARQPGARMNSETPAWLLDRLSILMLKIYHMREQTERSDADATHIERCRQKLSVLLEQKHDMSQCFDELVEDILAGRRYMKVYRQMKMYNDASLNPVLYKKARSS